MRTRILSVTATFALLLFSSGALASTPTTEGGKAKIDHAQFPVLQQQFASGPDVTKACMSCHKDAAKQVQTTQHWTWEYVNPDSKQLLGKRHIVNNFCTSVSSNLASCAACHVGYGLKDAKFDFTSEANVDCLACHDTTGKYRKQAGAGNVLTKDTEMPAGSGKIVKGVDLKLVAQHVGKTSRETCGACHFRGGGGDGVKHGDLDTSLEGPDRALDVHMDRKGNNFTCATCHKTVSHQVPGSRYAPTAMNYEHGGLGCQNCHGTAPHSASNATLDKHTQKIACQTCHIPSFARGGVATKLWWDWSTAGRRGPDGKPLVKTDDDGNETYNGTKGDFVWAENVTPDYIWFNGKVDYTLLSDKVDKTAEPIRINAFQGGPTDGKSKIWPVKTFRGKQAYDPVNKTIVVTHLAGIDDTAYWTNLNWEKAVAVGMSSVKLPFSGKVDFIATESTWPINHMVAPKDKALRCIDCHSPNGRLAKVPGLSMWSTGK